MLTYFSVPADVVCVPFRFSTWVGVEYESIFGADIVLLVLLVLLVCVGGAVCSVWHGFQRGNDFRALRPVCCEHGQYFGVHMQDISKSQTFLA